MQSTSYLSLVGAILQWQAGSTRSFKPPQQPAACFKTLTNESKRLVLQHAAAAGDLRVVLSPTGQLH
eukprot:CAMPEP_0174293350 /NCGR_PEP_ID=MMETSP0809-20121228/38275_1 /TAXON_ID=73025 ORGANISM="Eutreptiella gymnastica-like, Strain CCMP1594" /NCGR_SAMPLE_ID=MMETSP0809 /ASSEMBLY_ACC=CAM_ASM_000658 /LENGTH=66 /DNA_ID=CAMNT_0015394047 /DNA_START=198 /DNA_END=395 /DNA_ORIENTATION=-